MWGDSCRQVSYPGFVISLLVCSSPLQKPHLLPVVHWSLPYSLKFVILPVSSTVVWLVPIPYISFASSHSLHLRKSTGWLLLYAAVKKRKE